MPRIGRLHITGACHHAIERHLECRAGFRNDKDEHGFVARFASTLHDTNRNFFVSNWPGVGLELPSGNQSNTPRAVGSRRPRFEGRQNQKRRII